MSWRQSLTRNPLSRRLLYWAEIPRSRRMIQWILPHLNAGERVLDLGAGSCVGASLLLAEGFEVQPVDVADYSVIDNLPAMEIEEAGLPFPENQFDVCLLGYVLHHVREPEQVLQEASRVARRVIVMEDVVFSRGHRRMTELCDSLMNLEFRGHPHSNRSPEDWRKTFHDLGLSLLAELPFQRSKNPLWPIVHGAFVLDTGKHRA